MTLPKTTTNQPRVGHNRTGGWRATLGAARRIGYGVALAAALALAPMEPALAQPAPTANHLHGCITDFDPGLDYFPDKAELDHADNFAVTYHGSYKIVTVAEPSPGAAAESYVLLQCGAPVPALDGALANAPVIEVPVATMFAESTVQLPMLEAVGRLAALTGIGAATYATNPYVHQAVAAGRVVEFAPTFTVDVERAIDAGPDIYMTDGYAKPEHELLGNAGIAVVGAAEWLEATVLGRAEWLKYVALFFNEEAIAEVAFAAIDAAYADAAALVADVPEAERPLVLAGATFSGSFWAAGGRSYVAQNIADAGGRYVFADNNSTGSVEFGDLEIVVDRASDAHVWLHASNSYRTLADIRADDSRMAALAAAQAGEVWIYDRIMGPGGGVDYFESGVLRPDLVLRDLIKIFHPELMEDAAFTYYRSITVE